MAKIRFRDPFKYSTIDEKLIREHLALERTKLANERTLLSYTQASLYFLLGGLALLQLEDYENLRYIGHLAIFFCLLFLSIGIWRFIVLKKKMKKLLRPEEELEKDGKIG